MKFEANKKIHGKCLLTPFFGVTLTPNLTPKWGYFYLFWSSFNSESGVKILGTG